MGRVIPVLVGLFALAIGRRGLPAFSERAHAAAAAGHARQPGLRRRSRDAGAVAGQGLGPEHRLRPHDPYTGQTIAFTRGPTTSEAVQIDHVISLSDAWYRGAREWDDQRRRDFANDPRNLLTVVGQANFDKAFRDATAWLPPNQAFRCQFVARQIDVKAAYGLWVSKNEKRAMDDVLARY